MKKESLVPMYVIYGTESFLMEEKYKQIIDLSTKEEERDFNLSIYDAQETPIEVAIEDAETPPFFGDYRVIVIQNASFLTGEKKIKIEHDVKRLERYINEPSLFSIVVFLVHYEKLDERRKIVKQLRTNATMIEAKPLSEQELIKWIERHIKEKGGTIEQEATYRLLTLVGTNMATLINELNKLTMYADKNIITSEIVERLVSRTLEQDVFALTEQVVKRDISSSLRIFHDLLKNKEEPIKIIALLASQFRLIYQVKWLASSGYGQQQITAKLKVHPYRVKLAQNHAHAFTEMELNNLMKKFAEADYAMKTSAVDGRVVIEMLLVGLKKSSGR